MRFRRLKSRNINFLKAVLSPKLKNYRSQNEESLSVQDRLKSGIPTWVMFKNLDVKGFLRRFPHYFRKK
jgi:hypothetical protein